MNFRAILALAFTLMPSIRINLRKICLFFSYPRADYWFSDQLFRNENLVNYQLLGLDAPPSSQMFGQSLEKE